MAVGDVIPDRLGVFRAHGLPRFLPWQESQLSPFAEPAGDSFRVSSQYQGTGGHRVEAPATDVLQLAIAFGTSGRHGRRGRGGASSPPGLEGPIPSPGPASRKPRP